jgi:hypothetical protein
MARFALLAATAWLIALTATSAGAAPPPPGCAGLAFADEKGDVPAEAGPTATNLDITDGYFTFQPGGTVKATMKIADMSLTPPPPATAVSWYMTWTVKDVTYYVSLETDVTGTENYETGTYGPNAAGTGNSYTPTGATKGEVTPGPDGGITWDVPKAAKGAAGQTLTKPAGQSFQLVQNGLGGGVLLFGDETDPDTGRSYEVGRCESGGSAGGGATPVTTPAAGGTGTTGPATGPAPSSPQSQPAPKLALKLVSKTVKPSKGVLAIRLRASDSVTQVGARVRKGTKAFGTGRLAKIAKGATATLKVRAKQAKKGTYTLDVTARGSDGRLASGAFRLKVR